ncbi:hypothetical protein TSAR_012830 [Trichomalopsis sarcophagae]|uniref:Centriolar and ciliogenesis-associated protein HYLS1 C-terminal domain-containing protein n=1 Tax=Trichomalopsis sarcophagae TaxID=543379 RepID=A0A232EUR6_9HYME|nr:hypothetical protein TSAR_012830 [Trichomalopsis sarcophagae]
MEEETYDDPKQVLVILNSLGVVGVTTSELKAFMKELKAYKKVKRKMCQQSKDKIKMKILQKQDPDKIFQVYNSRQSLIEKTLKRQEKEFNSRQTSIETTLKRQEQEFNSRQTSIEKTLKRQEQDFTPRHNSISMAQNGTEIHASSKQSSEFANKENNVENRIIISLENLKCSKGKSPHKKTPMKLTREQKEADEIHSVRTCGSVKKILVEPASSKSKKPGMPVSSRSDNTESCSRSKSFIRPQIPCTESKSSLSSKKMATDPVTLYKKYKDFWDQLSIPGEENHTKLRWSVREKMLGQHPVPKVKNLFNLFHLTNVIINC